MFDGKRYDALVARHRRPFLVINATNVSLGERFEFNQDQFDLLGSDLSSYPVARAVAWMEKRPGLPVIGRQLNAEVLSAAIDASSDPSYSSISSIRRIGNSAANMSPKAATTSSATSLCTISRPPSWTVPSKPQWFMSMIRRSSIGTGQPGFQDTPIIRSR